MRCPRCPKVALVAAELEGGLHGRHCPSCGGNWVPWESYQTWWAKTELRKPEVQGDVLVSDSDLDAVVPCTACGGSLLRYKVGFDLQFTVNRCFSCKGLWLDRGEWELLRSRNFHDDLEMVLSQSWQEKITRHETEEAERARVRERLGADFEQVVGMVEFINAHPQRHLILRALQGEELW
jgi:Zn-finger nucleic acid-binding protein